MPIAPLSRRSSPPDTNGIAKVVGASTPIVVLALVVYGLRICSRLKPRPGYRPHLGWDDYTVSLGVVSVDPAGAGSY
jgi:hypothetical protein